MKAYYKFIGLATNAALIAVSTLWFRPELLNRLSFWAVVGIATLLCEADLAREEKTPELDRLPDSNPVLVLCHLTGLVVFLVWWSAIVFATSDEAFRLLTGISIAAVGTVVRRRAVVSLGDAFVSDVRPRPEVAKLKTNGVYARVRHPSELGLLLASLGAGFATGAAPSLTVSLAVLLPLSYIRVRIEERNLRDEFGKTYVDYEKRAGRFLPRLWRRISVS